MIHDSIQQLFFRVSSRASGAYSRYWLHKYQAVAQFNRMHSRISERAMASQYLEEPDLKQPDAMRLYFHFGSHLNQAVMADVHLYFISLDNTMDMMKTMLSEEPLVPLKKACWPFVSSLEHYTHGRNTFEHFDERLPGGKRHENVAETKSSPEAGPRRCLGGLQGYTYTFGGKSWDLSHTEFQRIVDGLKDFESRLHSHIEGLPDVPEC